MSFFEELKRRNVSRVILTYAVAGWLLVEVMDLLTDAFEAPSWVIKVFIGAVAFGAFPVAIFSWIYEITPDGIKKEATDGPIHEPGASRKLNIAIIVMLAIAIGFFVEQRINRVGQDESQPVVEQTSESASPPMLAVLPFVSASLTGDSEFFAVGVHDDLLTQLAQLHSIRVISRTSVLEYRDTVRNIREIGKALGADAILEGGVQSAGNRIRINAQLIDAKTDEHLWAQTYDRELSPSSIFDVQAEIARAITSALHATLTEQDDSQLAAIPTENMAAYRAYRRAMAFREVYGGGLPDAYREALEEAVALDPTFTRAWAELAGNLSYENFFDQDEIPRGVARTEEIIEKIRMLAPNSADYFIGQAYYTYYTLKDYDRADQFITQAQNLRPSDVHIVELKSWIQRRQGDYEGRLETIRTMQKLDPRNPGRTTNLINSLVVMHQYDEAWRELKILEPDEYDLASTHNLLHLREHQDWDQWAADSMALDARFEDEIRPDHLWDGHIARRDYAEAEKLLVGMPGPGESGHSEIYLGAKQQASIVTYFLSGQDDRLNDVLIESRAHVEKSLMSDGSFTHYDQYLDMLLVTAAEGNRDEAERMARRYQRGAAADLAQQALTQHYVCQALAMVGSVERAVECLRDGIAKPSLVMSFFEPFLPYYDPIRESPEFIALLSEL